jgi:Raf kinase inhibitor-like YbhB/YbcL family protein
MNHTLKTALCRLAIACFALSLCTILASPLFAQPATFQLTSSTFSNGTTLPISMIFNIVVNGVNVCSIDGSPGGNQSPELSWTNAPVKTQSFAVVLYDVTADFTHWGMYNISGSTTGLPAGAGVLGSTYGSQITNDFGFGGAGEQYDGPCPPADYPPDVHHYMFTVYALDTMLHVTGTTNFPPNAENLYHALINAGQYHHILATARLVGFYSTTPAK